LDRKARSREKIRREIDTYFGRIETEKVDGRRGSRFEGYWVGSLVRSTGQQILSFSFLLLS